ncbi:hypothetical protein NYQ66_21150 [Aquibacillus koreensis]|nr:hypothetical protein [Aquibacillus koreensis]MCT2538254.1 hypothetical protein [Aquibacillus koreensis]
MNNFSNLVESVEEQLNRTLQEDEREFLVWLYQEHQDEIKINA